VYQTGAVRKSLTAKVPPSALRSRTPAKESRELDLTDSEADRLGGRAVARRGRRPGSKAKSLGGGPGEAWRRRAAYGYSAKGFYPTGRREPGPWSTLARIPVENKTHLSTKPQRAHGLGSTPHLACLRGSSV
jgi:hypothetical protein